MSINRRTFTKALAAAPFAFLPRLLGATGPVPNVDGALGFFNVIVHGMMFMRPFDNGNSTYRLELIAPPISGHVLMVGTFENVTQLQQDIDWVQGTGLTGGSQPPSFKSGTLFPSNLSPSILQFQVPSAEDLSKSRKHTIKLPWPVDIVPLRLGDVNKYLQPNNGSVGTQLLTNCRTNNLSGLIATVICLRYSCSLPVPTPAGSPLALNFHVYHQSCSLDSSVAHTNAALVEAANTFKMFKFDLTLNQNTVTLPVPIGGSPETPVPGVARQKDELTLQEDGSYLDWTSACEGSTQLRKQLEKKYARPSTTKSKLLPRVNTAANPANCPGFFVG